jgi:major vault protein
VAGISFDDFHKNSAKVIRVSVFGLDENKRVSKRLLFPQNNLVLTSIDIQSVEPVDQRTRDALQKSVQLAIEVRERLIEWLIDKDNLFRLQPTHKKLKRSKLK